MGRGKSGSRGSRPRDRDTDRWPEAWDTWSPWDSASELRRKFVDDFAGDFKATEAEESVTYKYWEDDGNPAGYIKTGNSFRINQKFYDPANDGKSLEELFPRTNRNGEKVDIRTVRTLDKLIDQNKTKRNAIFTRYTTDNALESVFGLTSEQVRYIREYARTGQMDKLKEMSDGLKGRTSFSKSYTSTSANREANVFKSQPFERRIYVPEGTNAFACRKNPIESETVFGRGMKTSLMKITYENGHIVLHEYMEGYDKRRIPK